MSGSWLQKTLGKPVVWPPRVERLVRQGIPIQQGHLKGARCQRTQPVLQPDVKKASRKKKKKASRMSPAQFQIKRVSTIRSKQSKTSWSVHMGCTQFAVNVNNRMHLL